MTISKVESDVDLPPVLGVGSDPRLLKNPQDYDSVERSLSPVSTWPLNDKGVTVAFFENFEPPAVNTGNIDTQNGWVESPEHGASAAPVTVVSASPISGTQNVRIDHNTGGGLARSSVSKLFTTLNDGYKVTFKARATSGRTSIFAISSTDQSDPNPFNVWGWWIEFRINSGVTSGEVHVFDDDQNGFDVGVMVDDQIHFFEVFAKPNGYWSLTMDGVRVYEGTLFATHEEINGITLWSQDDYLNVTDITETNMGVFDDIKIEIIPPLTPLADSLKKNNGDYEGFPLLQQGIIVPKTGDPAAFFDGNGDRGVIPVAPNLKFVRELSVVTWIKSFKTTVPAAVIQQEYGPGGLWGIFATSLHLGEFQWFKETAPSTFALVSVTGNTTIDDGKTHMLVATFKNGLAKFYVDGALEAFDDQGANLLNTDAVTDITIAAALDFTKLLISLGSRYSIFASELSSSQINDLLEAGISTTHKNIPKITAIDGSDQIAESTSSSFSPTLSGRNLAFGGRSPSVIRLIEVATGIVKDTGSSISATDTSISLTFSSGSDAAGLHDILIDFSDGETALRRVAVSIS